MKYNPTFARGEIIAFDIKSSLTWGDAKKVIKGLIVPTATHIDKNYKFKTWSPNIPSDKDLVESKTYTAVYEKIKANPKEETSENNNHKKTTTEKVNPEKASLKKVKLQPKTGVAGIGIFAVISSLASAGLYFTRNKKEN